MSDRRSFLKIGVLAAMTLAAGGAVYRLVHPATPRRFVLDSAAGAVLRAIVPAMLGTVLPQQAAARAAALEQTAQGVVTAIRALPLTTQQDVQDLFGLLALAPARRWLAGVPDSWERATPAQVSDFLQAWRHHRFAMLQTAYQALHDLILATWYADPAHWEAIGYPGPIQELA